MTSKSKIKSVDFYRKIPRDLTEASLTGAGLSIIAAFFMILLFGMELNDYLTMSTTTSVIVDKSSDGDFLIIDFDMSFPALSCEFASVDVSDVLGTKPSWEKAENIIRERYDPEMDGRILLGKVDCTEEVDLCTRNHIQGYPSIRIYRKGSDLREADGHNEHESYYGDRDTESLVKTMEELVAPISLESQRVSSDAKLQTNGTKRPAPTSGGCRIEGFVRVKKVPGNLVISAHSAAHSFDASQMNMSHVISHFSFGKRLSQQAISDMKKFLPYLGQSYDKLSSNAYITNPKESNENVTIEHYLQVVKTEVMTGTNKVVEDYEYTSHSSLVHSLDIPVAKFHYEPSPMQVLITETAKSFSHFLTNVCAIIGGVFTVAGILDSLLLNTLRLVKKVELGKNF
ncbi:PREDICTED: protein disulfide-isomerase 5-3-like isoform X2 [Ipomoea nil]|uniref:protein disulfide-isomerase 5-3-like isoform X2 n=1 Tax=Ipomoea nil TaxID=35883 RepID=UPI0009014836|nr:PREDICTED: protein disulfide-isomerase 5-3-like isoform X2 [Ipomoea nil]